MSLTLHVSILSFFTVHAIIYSNIYSNELIKNCGFRLTKWISSHSEMNLALPEKDLFTCMTLLPLDGCVGDQVLVVHWDVGKDSFHIISNLIC